MESGDRVVPTLVEEIEAISSIAQENSWEESK